ncbi:aldo/keto reductase [candidate division BRC1 bacterium HGW-BRC1-1]|jgi:aryl-alcohol dehydrogenase-like predicted oxidoreductase|nr:MAG: aldo/keto reductase [candidate division BRC1 bacterium HGW-BRC1-1]
MTDNSKLTPGFATADGTAAYAARHPAAERHFGVTQGLTLGSIGLGTYLGDLSEERDAGYRESVALAVKQGVNVVDTAISYRLQHSERNIAAALREAFANGVSREEIVVCTKAGFLTLDPEYLTSPDQWLQREIIAPGLAAPEDIVAGQHCMAPRCLRHMLNLSRANLGLDCIDVLYIHNPESQLESGEPLPRPEFMARLRSAFEALEAAVAEGQLRHYGIATWSGLRTPPDTPSHLPLQEIAALAAEVGGDNHHFRFVQAPLNLAMPEASVLATQMLNGHPVPLMQAALELGITTVGSAPLMQGHLTTGIPGRIKSSIPGLKTDAARAIQFARSAPGLAVTLVGMSKPTHVRQNLELALRSPLTIYEYAAIFQNAVGNDDKEPENEND